MIATHKLTHMPADDIYLPVRVGNALSDEDYNYQGDDEGCNISKKNPYFCELTALYWGWKNLKNEYIGLVHYRRFFSVKKNIWKYSSVLNRREIEEILSTSDVVLPKKRNYYIETIYSHYMHTHNLEHLEITRDILCLKYPEYVSSFDKIMKCRSAHMFNMLIMKKDILNNYCEWLFDVLFVLEKEIDVSCLAPFDARLFGRISELLLDVWIDKNKVKYVETNFVQIGKINTLNKIKGFLLAKFFGVKYTQSR